jgi:hypothetical protein
MPGVKKTMQEFAAGMLRSGSKTGPPVTKRKQAVAIALNEQRKAGAPVPPKRQAPVAKMPKRMGAKKPINYY